MNCRNYNRIWNAAFQIELNWNSKNPKKQILKKIQPNTLKRIELEIDDDDDDDDDDDNDTNGRTSTTARFDQDALCVAPTSTAGASPDVDVFLR